MILAHSNSFLKILFQQTFSLLGSLQKIHEFLALHECCSLYRSAFFPVTLSRSKESGEQLPSVADVNIGHFIIMRWLFQDHQGLRWRYAEDLLMKLLEFGHVQPPPKLRVDPPSCLGLRMP